MSTKVTHNLDEWSDYDAEFAETLSASEREAYERHIQRQMNNVIPKNKKRKSVPPAHLEPPFEFIPQHYEDDLQCLSAAAVTSSKQRPLKKNGGLKIKLKVPTIEAAQEKPQVAQLRPARTLVQPQPPPLHVDPQEERLFSDYDEDLLFFSDAQHVNVLVEPSRFQLDSLFDFEEYRKNLHAAQKEADAKVRRTLHPSSQKVLLLPPPSPPRLQPQPQMPLEKENPKEAEDVAVLPKEKKRKFSLQTCLAFLSDCDTRLEKVIQNVAGAKMEVENVRRLLKTSTSESIRHNLADGLPEMSREFESSVKFEAPQGEKK